MGVQSTLGGPLTVSGSRQDCGVDLNSSWGGNALTNAMMVWPRLDIGFRWSWKVDRTVQALRILLVTRPAVVPLADLNSLEA